MNFQAQSTNNLIYKLLKYLPYTMNSKGLCNPEQKLFFGDHTLRT